MSEENEQQEVEQEIAPVEETTEELPTEEETPEEETQLEDDSVSLSKSEFTKLKRKAIAYDSGKQQAKEVLDKDERFERLELRADGYSKDEIDEIMALGGTRVLSSKIVQSAIKTMRADSKSKDAREPLSSKSPVYKKFTQDDLSKMSSKEMEKILQE